MAEPDGPDATGRDEGPLLLQFVGGMELTVGRGNVSYFL